MRALKKLSCILLAVLLVMGMTTTAFAASGNPDATDPAVEHAGKTFDEDATFTIQINEPMDDHSFNAYQIFSGKLYGDNSEGSTKEIMTDVEWGSSLTEAGINVVKSTLGLKAPKDTAKDAEEALQNGAATADALAAALAADAGNLKDPTLLTRTDDGKGYSAEVTTGYYMIVDSVKEGSEVDNQAVSDYIVQVVDDVDMQPKSDVPQVTKKVKDTNDSDGSTSDWQDTADYDVNDVISFQLTATLPKDYAKYDSYKLVFHDTQSVGLTFGAITSVTLNGEAIDSYALNADPEDGCSFEVTVNLTSEQGAAGQTVVVEYTATLNENAKVGAEGNPNEVYLEYSNDSNSDSTGHTPNDKVVVFTFDVSVNKEDDEHNPLAGAAFTLAKYVGVGVEGADEDGYKEVKAYEAGEAVTFDFKGIDDGRYRITETKTPDGYNSIDPIFFKVTAEHSQDPEELKLTGLTIAQTDEKGVALEEGKATAEFTVDVAAGTGKTTVVNQEGLQLPETGGIGTTIFYTIGGILVAAAVVLLITKKRMTKEG